MRQRNCFFCFLWSIKIEHNIQTRVPFDQHQREGIGRRILHHWVQRTTRDCVLSKLLYYFLHRFFLIITQLISLRMKQRRLKSLWRFRAPQNSTRQRRGFAARQSAPLAFHRTWCRVSKDFGLWSVKKLWNNERQHRTRRNVAVHDTRSILKHTEHWFSFELFLLHQTGAWRGQNLWQEMRRLFLWINDVVDWCRKTPVFWC